MAYWDKFRRPGRLKYAPGFDTWWVDTGAEKTIGQKQDEGRSDRHAIRRVLLMIPTLFAHGGNFFIVQAAPEAGGNGRQVEGQHHKRHERVGGGSTGETAAPASAVASTASPASTPALIASRASVRLQITAARALRHDDGERVMFDFGGSFFRTAAFSV